MKIMFKFVCSHFEFKYTIWLSDVRPGGNNKYYGVWDAKRV